MKLTATIALGLLIAGCDQAYAANTGAEPAVQQSVTPLYLGVGDAGPGVGVGDFLPFTR